MIKEADTDQDGKVCFAGEALFLNVLLLLTSLKYLQIKTQNVVVFFKLNCLVAQGL